MKHTHLFGSMLLVLGVACSTSPHKTEVREAKDFAAEHDRLQNQLVQIASAARGRVGVSAIVIETNETFSLNSQDHHPMQSVYKLPICVEIFHQVDSGKVRLEQKIRVTKNDFISPNAYSPIRDRYPNGVDLTIGDLIRFAIVQSDGTASDVLMRLAGGAATIQNYLDQTSIKDMTVLNTEKELAQDWQIQYRNWATPDAAVALLRAIHERRGLSESSQQLLLKYMVDSIPGQKRLKGLLPPGTTVAHKTGTSGTRDGITAATNDIGIVTLPNGKHLAIAVFVSDSPADESTREAVIAKMARAIWDFVTSTSK